MFGFKKKEDAPGLPVFNDGLPSIKDYQRPQLPAFDMSAEDRAQIHGLPSFPDSAMSKGFSQSIIKNAIEDSDKELPELPEWSPKEAPRAFKSPTTTEMNEWVPTKETGRGEGMASPPSFQPPFASQRDVDKRPMFIKLEKFKESKESLIKIAEKLDQMDELLKMIKDVKAKEDAEITEWEKDIENIKSRIGFINREIFENAY